MKKLLICLLLLCAACQDGHKKVSYYHRPGEPTMSTVESIEEILGNPTLLAEAEQEYQPSEREQKLAAIFWLMMYNANETGEIHGGLVNSGLLGELTKLTSKFPRTIQKTEAYEEQSTVAGYSQATIDEKREFSCESMCNPSLKSLKDQTVKDAIDLGAKLSKTPKKVWEAVTEPWNNSEIADTGLNTATDGLTRDTAIDIVKTIGGVFSSTVMAGAVALRFGLNAGDLVVLTQDCLEWKADNCYCGNGVVDDGETCDKAIPGSCITECIDDDLCTVDNLANAGSCQVRCIHTRREGCTKDCNGEEYGTAKIDMCGQCTGGSTGLERCEQDCAGVWGGSAYGDDCDRCVGGNTGRIACEFECNEDSDCPTIDYIDTDPTYCVDDKHIQLFEEQAKCRDFKCEFVPLAAVECPGISSCFQNSGGHSVCNCDPKKYAGRWKRDLYYRGQNGIYQEPMYSDSEYWILTEDMAQMTSSSYGTLGCEEFPEGEWCDRYLSVNISDDWNTCTIYADNSGSGIFSINYVSTTGEYSAVYLDYQDHTYVNTTHYVLHTYRVGP